MAAYAARKGLDPDGGPSSVRPQREMGSAGNLSQERFCSTGTHTAQWRTGAVSWCAYVVLYTGLEGLAGSALLLVATKLHLRATGDFLEAKPGNN
jgi:hypothetical protein